MTRTQEAAGTFRNGLPEGYSMRDMADDYAAMIGEEFGGPVDAIGTTTGGSIAQHFAADHPDLVRRPVLHASAYTLGDAAKEVQWRVGQPAGQQRWREASAVLLGFMMSPSRFGKIIYPGKGHAPAGKQFGQDVLTFLGSG